MTASRRIALLPAVTVLLVSLLACKSPLSPSTDGPMRVLSPHGTLAQGPVGTRLTDGFDVLHLKGDANAEILSVRSVGGAETMKFLGAYIAGPDRNLAAWSQLKGFPPQEAGLGDLKPAKGYLVKPRNQTRLQMGYELLLGYEVIRADKMAARTHIEIVYRVGDKEYLWRQPSQLVYCPAGEDGEKCFDTYDDQAFEN